MPEHPHDDSAFFANVSADFEVSDASPVTKYALHAVNRKFCTFIVKNRAYDNPSTAYKLSFPIQSALGKSPT